MYTNNSVEPTLRPIVSSQSERIKQHLQSGATLTSLEALHLFGCARLASRISDLRKSGCDIAREMVTLPNGKRIARYFYVGQ